MTTVAWTLPEDIGYYRQSFIGQSEMIYRADTLSAALPTSEYREFVGALARLPPASRALVYYEVIPSASHYLFAVAAETAEGCVAFISDAEGVHESGCRSIPNFEAAQVVDSRAVRDPPVAGLVQIDASGEYRRTLLMLGDNDVPAESSRASLIEQIDRAFGDREPN
jgi:hypothetical protein